MRVRFWVLLAAALVAVAAVGCANRVSPAPASSPAPTKTLRPTFTATVPEPAATPTVGQAGQQAGGQSDAGGEVNKPTAEPASPTPPPPTEAPSPTPEAAAFTVSSASVNVRSGPGTTFPVLGRLNQGQSFPISGKSEDGAWWEFDYDGKQGWVIGTNVTATGSDAVQIAQNIPQQPTVAPRPTARPAAARPAQPAPPTQAPAQPAPAAANKYATSGTGVQPNTNDFVTVYCILYNQAGSGLLPGELRLLRDGQVVGTATFSSQATYYLTSGYNAGCKVEVSPAVNGNYTAVLVEGGQVVSDPINFTVTGPDNRIQFVAWKQR
jgi:uncharacterized protein YraI